MRLPELCVVAALIALLPLALSAPEPRYALTGTFVVVSAAMFAWWNK